MKHGGDESRSNDKKKGHEGRVEQALPSAQFQVRLDDGRSIRAMVARESRVVIVKVQPGDRVEVALYPYDPTRGSILRKIG